VICGCTGLKHLYMFLLMMLLYRGPWLAKLWFIPLGMLLLYGFNLFRIGAIPWLVGNDYSTFAIWHEAFRLSYYGLFFVLWVIWEEWVIDD